MKIIHCADLHLDSKMKILNTTESSERKRELIDNFKRLADYAAENGVRVIMICGDMFDSNNIRVMTKRRVVEIIKNHQEVDFLYLTGNHDKNDFLEGTENLTNLKTFPGSGWTTYSYGNVEITGANIMNNNVSGLADQLVLNRAQKNIVMLHGQEEDSARDAGGGEIIPMRLFADKHIDYLALGHIHSYSSKTLDDRGVYVYSGCLEGRGYDESGAKGFVLLETDDMSYEFVPFARRLIYLTEVEAQETDGTEELISRIMSSVPEAGSRDMVKAIITGEVPEDYVVDEENIRNFCEGRFFNFRLEVKTKIKIDLEELRLDRSLKGEFLRKVYGSELSEEEKQCIIKLGLDAFAGEVR